MKSYQKPKNFYLYLMQCILKIQIDKIICNATNWCTGVWLISLDFMKEGNLF